MINKFTISRYYKQIWRKKKLLEIDLRNLPNNGDQEWPLKSMLDPKVYGPPESAITIEFIEQQIKGFMTFDEVIKKIGH